jgi:hypothetical protein
MQVVEALTHLEQAHLHIAKSGLDGVFFFVIFQRHGLVQLLAFLAAGLLEQSAPFIGLI